MTFSRKFIILILVQLLLVASVGLKGVVASNYSHDDVRFRGMVFQADTTYTGYMTVKVFDSLSGKNLEGEKVRVGPFGVSRCNINVRSNTKITTTDHVEVYGLHEKVGYMDGPTVDVDLCHSNNYYIKKLPKDGGGEENGDEDDSEDNKGPCRVNLKMDKRTYSVGDTAKVTITSDRVVEYRLTKHSSEGMSFIEKRWLKQSNRIQRYVDIEKPQGSKYLELEAADQKRRSCGDRFNYKVRVERNANPVATCSFTPKTPEVNENVKFKGTQSTDPDGYIRSYDWDIGVDGHIEAVGKVIYKAFNEPGDYRIVLIVEDNEGKKDTALCTLTVEKKNEKPSAKIDFDPKSPFVGESIVLSGSESYDPDGKIVRYKWDFNNDGKIDETGANAIYDCDEPGENIITLFVQDNKGKYDREKIRFETKVKSKVKVTVQDQSGDPLDAKIYLGNHTRSTGQDGSTEITDLIPKDYTIQVTKTGYKSASRELSLHQGGTRRITIELTHRSKVIAKRLDGWTYDKKALRRIVFDGTEYQIHLLRNNSGFISYLPLTKTGELPPSSKEFIKITTAASFVNTSRPNSIKGDAEFFNSMADKFLAIQFAGETLIQIRDTAASLLGETLSTYATGGASALTKEVGSTTLKETTKHFAKKFSRSLAKNMVESNLNLEGSIKNYAKSEILASKKACSKVLNLVDNNHQLDEEEKWRVKEFEKVRENFKSCTVKLIPSMHLLGDLNPEADVFSQLKDVSEKVVEGASGVDPQLLYDLLIQDLQETVCDGLCQAINNYAGMNAGVEEKALKSFNTELEKKSAKDILSGLQKLGYYSSQ
ncbi:carboxypeptidase regulatory-like domain-containing protein [Candidatus Bipolaricaulota bacterium]|nr:carboxypeptidase regulatory-like domain-containing protein [Candidatus Bipolaricaulota bacterium]